MTDRDTPGARWFREEKARREREAAEKERLKRQKALDALARARAAADRARQDAFEPVATPADEERALIERIVAEPDPRVRERLESQLRSLRERVRREAERRPPGVPKR
jgi:predicted transcriptional regulator